MGLFDGLASDGGWLSQLFARPTSPGFLGESPNYDPNGGWLRPAGPQGFGPADYARLADAFGGQQAAPSFARQAGMAQAIQNNPPPGMTPPSLPMNVSGAPQPADNAGMSQFPQPVPPEAALPPKAQPVEGTTQPVQAAQAQPVGMGDRFNAFANNLSSGRNPIAMLANAAQGLSTGKRFDAEGVRQQNQAQVAQAVYQSLVARGYPHQVAMGMAQASGQDTKLAEKILGEAYAIPKGAEELAVRRSMGMTDAGMSGGAGSGNPFDILTQKNEATARGTATGTKFGETMAEAQIKLPTALAQAKEAEILADKLLAHPGRKGNVWWHGKMSNMLPDSAILGNTDALDANSILKQLKGGAFLEAYSTLKGGGAIANAEGEKATGAIMRADRAQSEAEFNRAINDFKGHLRLAVDAASRNAGQSAPNGFKGNTEQVKAGSYDWSPGGGLKQRQ